MLSKRGASVVSAALLTAGMLLVPGGTAAASGTVAAAPAAEIAPAIYPVPQQRKDSGPAVKLHVQVTLVAPADADGPAVAAVTTALVARGAKITRVNTLSAAPNGHAAVVLGAGDGNQARQALARNGIAGAGDLVADGYVLATATLGGRGVVLLDGHDATGSYYAAQSLRQVLVGSNGSLQVPGIQVRDWPAMPIRGTIEGFYGTPWSHAARLAQLDYYGQHKMNTYVYSPKDDPYLRDQWRDPYPAADLAQLSELVQRSAADHVDFTYAVSPGLSICYSSAADTAALVAKFQSLWDIGVRDFAVPLDDISYTNWNCDADRTTFGTGGGAAGAAQATLLNAVQTQFIDTHPGAKPLQMVPTEYYDVSDSAYKTALRTKLDPRVIVEWTGPGVVVKSITAAQAAKIKQIFGHDILIWDNYPVNDYVTSRLLLAPYQGREPGLDASIVGITANPMIQPEASKTSLFTVADYTWNDRAYDPQKSWQAGLSELAGGDPTVSAALAAFADLNYTSTLDPVQAPALAARLASFWPAFEAGDQVAADQLDAYLKLISTAPTVLGAGMSAGFISDVKPWLESAGAWGSAAQHALAMLVAQRAGNGALALAERAAAQADMAKARSSVYVGLGGGSVKVQVGDGVIDTFIARAMAENNRWLGVSGTRTTVSTTLPTYQNYVPDNIIDGDLNTFFWSSRSSQKGDTVTLDLGAVHTVSAISLHQAKATSPNDYIAQGVLEISVDGSNWSTVTTLNGAAAKDVEQSLPAGTKAQYVRLRATADSGNWVVIRGLGATITDSSVPLVSGTPAPATGSKLSYAADGLVETAYVAAGSPVAGDALVVTLPKMTKVDRVAVVGTGQGTVQVGSGGNWTDIGSISAKGYTEIAIPATNIDAARLVWVPGSPAPTIGEVIAHPVAKNPVSATLTPPEVELSLGETANTTANLQSDLATNVTASVSAAAPPGVTVTPASPSVVIARGAQPVVALKVAGVTAGSYQVPVTVQAPGMQAVVVNLTVIVHPPVSTTNVALSSNGSGATASSVEQNLPQFTPDHANDGDPTTRWSSGYDDNSWLQIAFPTPQHLGKVVISWEAAHATDYQLQTSSDGSTWTTAATVTGSVGGVETIWIEAQNVKYLRMQGVHRATTYGYSIYEMEAYPIAG